MKDYQGKNIKWWIGTISCVLFFVFIGIFVYAKMNFIWRGVQIIAQVDKIEGSEVVTVKGNAKNAVHLTINEREIFIDKDGNFKEYVSPLPGHSVIAIFAKDKFGKTAEKIIELYKEEKEKLVETEDVPTISSEELIKTPNLTNGTTIEIKNGTEEEVLLENN